MAVPVVCTTLICFKIGDEGNSNNHGREKLMIIVLAGGIVLVAVAILVVCVCVIKKNKYVTKLYTHANYVR